MLTVITILILDFYLVTSCPPNSLQNQIMFRNIAEEDQNFVEYLNKYDKKYCDNEEYLHRKGVFFDNLKHINELNAIEPGVYGINYFTDKTYEELAKNHKGLAYYNVSELEKMAVPMINAPESLDWTQTGCVTPVKDQKDCNSCFAFSAVGAIESQYCLKYGHLYTLSEQQALDCTPGVDCKTGGFMTQVFNYLAAVGGSIKEEDYPYQNVKDQCYFDPKDIVVNVTGGTHLKIKGEEDLKRAIYHYGPISFGMDAPPELYHNNGQIYSGAGCERLTDPSALWHAMLLVGYGKDDQGRKYWKVKNSWGATKWGDKGYGYILRGPNICRIYDRVATPFIADGDYDSTKSV